MLEKIFTIALSIATLNNSTPKAEIETPEDGTPRIYRITSEESKDIILDSYYILCPKADIISENNFSSTETTIPLSIRLMKGDIPNQGMDHIHNRLYLLMGGYPYKYVGYTDDDIADYIVNPYGIYTNDGEYIHYLLNKDDYEEPDNDGPAFVSSFSDQASGYDYYGILIPKDIHKQYARAIVLIGGYTYEYYNHAWISESNPEGINPELNTPSFIKYNSYAPFRNKTQSTNYLTNEKGNYTRVDDNSQISTADDNCYYYDALFDNELFINRAMGVGNYATNIMYEIYPSGPDYKYVNLSMYKIPDSLKQETYTQTLNNFYGDIGGFAYINNSFNNNYVLNRITNAEDDRNGNTWRYEYASEFIVLTPNRTRNGLTTMQILESHLIEGYTVSGAEIGIKIDAGLTDVFTLLAQAFSGFGTFFAIMIIPGITLGTLFLMPFITTLIIWLINLFKRH